MGQDPSQIRQELEETRLRVGEEVEALSYKTDVGARLDDYVDEKKQAVTSKVAGAKDAVVSTASKVVPSREQGRRLKRTAESNPVGLVIGGTAVGFLAGLLLPSTRVENERLGETADRVKEVAREAGHEAVERGREVAQEATQAAVETARERGSEEGRELTAELEDRLQQTQQQGQGAQQPEHQTQTL